MTEIKRGDRVRLTIEGEWGGNAWTVAEGEITGVSRPDSVTIRDEDIVTIEKVVEPIRDGEMVRLVMEGPWFGGDIEPGEQPVTYRGEFCNGPLDTVTVERI